jgi:hypothetical protein
MNGPVQSSRQLADNLLIWHAAISSEIEREDMTAEDFERSGAERLQCAESCAQEAEARRASEPETFFALMGVASRYFLTARAYFARAAELRKLRRPRLVSSRQTGDA